MMPVQAGEGFALFNPNQLAGRQSLAQGPAQAIAKVLFEQYERRAAFYRSQPATPAPLPAEVIVPDRQRVFVLLFQIDALEQGIERACAERLAQSRALNLAACRLGKALARKRNHKGRGDAEVGGDLGADYAEQLQIRNRF